MGSLRGSYLQTAGAARLKAAGGANIKGALGNLRWDSERKGAGVLQSRALICHLQGFDILGGNAEKPRTPILGGDSGMGAVPPKVYEEALTPRTPECGLVWRWVLPGKIKLK